MQVSGNFNHNTYRSFTQKRFSGTSTLQQGATNTEAQDRQIADCVENFFQLGAHMSAHEREIYKRFEAILDGPLSSNKTVFISRALHVGASTYLGGIQARRREVAHRIQEILPNEDVTIVVTLLTALYVANRGHNAHVNEVDKKPLWEEIRQRIRSITHEFVSEQDLQRVLDHTVPQ